MSLASDLGDRFKAEFAAKIIAVVAAGLLTVILARLLEPDDYGLLFLAISVLGMIEMFSKLGIAKSAARYVSTYKETDPGQLRGIFRFSFLLNILTIGVVCIALLLGYEQIARLVGEPELGPLLVVGVCYIVFHTLDQFVRTVLQGFEAIKPASVLLSVASSLRLLFAVGLVFLGYGAVGALLGYIISYAVTVVIGLGYLYVRLYKTVPSAEIETGIRRRIVEYTAPLTLTSAADVLDKRLDTILVGFFIGPVGVAYYTIGKQVIQFVETPMAALGFTLSPTYEAQKAKGNTEVAAKIYEEALTHGLLLYIPAAAGLILVAEPLVMEAFGTEYLGAVVVLQVLALYAVLRAIMKITSNGLDFLGRARERAIIKGITSILNVALNIVLIPLMGVVGAAIATVITYSIFAAANLYIMHLELEFRVPYVIRRTGSAVLITAVMSTVVYLLTGVISGIVTLISVVFVGVLVWALLTAGSGLVDIRRVLSVLF